MKTTSTSKPARITSWVLQIALGAAFIVMGVLPKLLGQFPSPQLFEKLGAEPMGRYAVGVWELVAAILILIPKTAAIGAVLVALAMVGAFASHLGPLGMMPEFVDPANPEADPVTLPGFVSLIFLALALVVIFLRRDQLPVIGKKNAPAS